MIWTVASTLMLAVVYLAVARFVDMNEKEPLWAMLMVFLLGAVGAVLTAVGASDVLLLASVWARASVEGVVKFLAMGAGVGVLLWYGQRRGWAELNGTMDGIVYGACGGLGFGVGQRLFQELSLGALSVPGLEVSHAASFGKIALAGLADGVGGAIIGAGFGLASEARAPFVRAIVPLISLAAGVVADGAYELLRRGDALGPSGALRANVALGVPVALFGLVAVLALRHERLAIRDHLDDEVQTGAVGAADLPLLKDVIARQLAYARTFLTFRLDLFFRLRGLHNLQVQLAFAKARVAREAEPARRARVEAEVAAIRAAAVESRRALDGRESAR